MRTKSTDASPTAAAATVEEEPLALTPDQAAERLGISPRTLWSLTAARKIPHLRLGKLVRYPVDALRAWLTKEAERGAKAR